MYKDLNIMMLYITNMKEEISKVLDEIIEAQKEVGKGELKNLLKAFGVLLTGDTVIAYFLGALRGISYERGIKDWNEFKNLVNEVKNVILDSVLYYR